VHNRGAQLLILLAAVATILGTIFGTPLLKGDDESPNGPNRILQKHSSCADWFGATVREREDFAADNRPTVAFDHNLPSKRQERTAFMYGFIFGECDRAQKRGHDPDDVELEDALAGKYPGSG
jgi:hypothetical protein